MTEQVKMKVHRVPRDLCWTADDGAHENLPIGEMVHRLHISLTDCVNQIEALCSEFDVPDSARAILAQISDHQSADASSEAVSATDGPQS